MHHIVIPVLSFKTAKLNASLNTFSSVMRRFRVSLIRRMKDSIILYYFNNSLSKHELWRLEKLNITIESFM